MLLLCLAAVGVGSLLAALNVAYRDFRYVVGFLVQLWMFGTPTIYMDYVGTEGPGRLTSAIGRGDRRQRSTTGRRRRRSRHPVARSPCHPSPSPTPSPSGTFCARR